MINEKYFTYNELLQIYNAAWEVGAVNLLGLAHSLPGYVVKARNEVIDGLVTAKTPDQHPVIQILIGHMDFLTGNGLGPDPDHVDKVEELIEARRPGVPA